LQKAQTIDLNGIFAEHFFHYGDTIYYLKKVTYISVNNNKEYWIVPLESIGHYCNIDSFIKLSSQNRQNPKNRLSSYSQYKNQDPSIELDDSVTYVYGGDIYYTNENKDLTIAFRLQGIGLLFESVCENYLVSGDYRGRDCPDIPEEDVLKAPIISILQIDSIFSLSAWEQEINDFKPFFEKKFMFGECD